jgi:hypothetical protein
MIRENVITLFNRLYAQHRITFRIYRELASKVREPSLRQHIQQLASNREEMALALLEHLNRFPASSLSLTAQADRNLKECWKEMEQALQSGKEDELGRLCWRNEKELIQVLEKSLQEGQYGRITRNILERHLIQTRHVLLRPGHMPSHQLSGRIF